MTHVERNVKLSYMVELRPSIMDTRVRFSEETMYVFHKVIFLKFTTKAVIVITGMHQHPSGCEPTISDISPSVYTTNLHRLDICNIHLVYIHNSIIAKLDYHTSQEPVDLFLTTPVVCTRQQ